MKILALIPARMGSSRFPGKPMAPILGKPMVGHVYQRVAQCPLLTTTAVATCDQIIVEYIESIGGEAVMTSDEHVRASDRCAEAVSKLEAKLGLTYDIVVMVQGDEPMTHPGMIEEALQPMIDDPAVRIVNLLGEINSREEFMDRNCIKVVCNLQSEAMYFSREPIPTLSKVTDPPTGKQVCIIPFRRDFLTEYTVMEQTPLEIAEAVDMMRVLENGGSVRMVPTKYRTQSVDTESDLIFVEQLMSKAEFE